MVYNLRAESQHKFEKALTICEYKTQPVYEIIDTIIEDDEERPIYADIATPGEIVLSTEDYTLVIEGPRRTATGESVIFEDGSEHDEYVMEGWYATVDTEELPEALSIFLIS